MKRSDETKAPTYVKIVNNESILNKTPKSTFISFQISPQRNKSETPKKDELIEDKNFDKIEVNEINSKENFIEYQNLQKEISEIQSQIDSLNDQLASIEFNDRKKLTELYSWDEDFQNHQSKINKKLVRKQILLTSLQNEFEDYKIQFSNTELFNLAANNKKEKELYQKQQNSIKVFYNKIEKTKHKLVNERKNPIYAAVKEQAIKIKELEDLLSDEIIKYKKLKDIYETESKHQRESENEIQDLTIQLEAANYKLEKRQKQHMHLMKKIQKENENLTEIKESSDTNEKFRKLLVGVFQQREINQKVQRALQTCGEIEFIQMISANAKPPRYFAFIQFIEHEAALKALNSFNQKTIDNQFLNIQWASDQPRDSPISKHKKKSKSSLSQKRTTCLRPVTERILRKYQHNNCENESRNQSPRSIGVNTE